MLQTISQPESTHATLRPLCVDLDGTLAKSDTLVDSLLALIRTRPALAFKLPGQLLSGKAAFKAFVTASVALDVAHLPYNHALLQFLREQHAQGRALYLATGADRALARRVADHLNLFTGVLGSDGATNLTGNNKLDGLRSQLGSDEFDYIGNAAPDLPLLAQAKEPMVANPTLTLRMRLRARGIQPVREFRDRRGSLISLLRAMRPHQWAKNLLIFLPLLLSHAIAIHRLLVALLAFCCFSLAASATYILNDLLDIESDRRHAQKRFRPFASGDLSAFTGVGLALALLLLAIAGARLLPLSFFGWLLLYLVSTLAYSTYFKRIPLVDVLILSGLYTLRLLAGSAATGTYISHWLAGFSVFLFFSLAIAKRFAELETLLATNSVPKNGRGYLLADIEQLRSFGTASAFAAVVIFAIYISGRDVTMLYRDPALLWLIMPLMILWLCRVWLLASRGELHEDPVVFALTDRMSLLIGAAVAVVALLAV
ncbi:MAG TPA: UbiA family prenyltransferase [Terracidiphilus sp.]|nr:UbiA family prenyltransferase [Terracidiphilus sp.]